MCWNTLRTSFDHGARSHPTEGANDGQRQELEEVSEEVQEGRQKSAKKSKKADKKSKKADKKSKKK